MTEIGYTQYFEHSSNGLLKTRLQSEWYGLLHDSRIESLSIPHPSTHYPVITLHSKSADGAPELTYLLTLPTEQWQSWLSYYLHCCFAQFQRLSRTDYYSTSKFLREFHHDSARLLVALHVELDDESILTEAGDLIHQAQHTMKCHLSLPEYVADTHTDILAVFADAKPQILTLKDADYTLSDYFQEHITI